MQAAMYKEHRLEMEKAQASFQDVLANRNEALVSMMGKLLDAQQQLQAAHQHAQEAEREKEEALAALSKKVTCSGPCMNS